MMEKIDHREDVERPIAVFETSLGAFEVELHASECPETVWNFINLAEGRQQTERGGSFYLTFGFCRSI
jgi:cyclophilin family peptidyl-prolyl cis-trans isomerase